MSQLNESNQIEDDYLNPFKNVLKTKVPERLLEISMGMCREKKTIKTIKDLLTWAHDTLDVTLQPVPTEDETFGMEVVCTNPKVQGVSFPPVCANKLEDVVFDAISYLAAIYLLENYDDYYFPES